MARPAPGDPESYILTLVDVHWDTVICLHNVEHVSSVVSFVLRDNVVVVVGRKF